MTSTDPCGYSVSSPLFITAAGGFSNAPDRTGDEATVTGSFAAGGVTGGFATRPRAARWSPGERSGAPADQPPVACAGTGGCAPTVSVGGSVSTRSRRR